MSELPTTATTTATATTTKEDDEKKPSLLIAFFFDSDDDDDQYTPTFFKCPASLLASLDRIDDLFFIANGSLGSIERKFLKYRASFSSWKSKRGNVSWQTRNVNKS